MIEFIRILVTVSLNYHQYSAIVDLHNFQFTVAQALRFSVFLATDLNTETSTTNHYEFFLAFLVQSPWNLGTQLKTLLDSLSTLHCTALCTNLSYNRCSLYRLRKDKTEKISHVIPSQRVHWRADCCLRTGCNTRPIAACSYHGVFIGPLPGNAFTCHNIY
jgi:hypothetical protein